MCVWSAFLVKSSQAAFMRPRTTQVFCCVPQSDAENDRDKYREHGCVVGAHVVTGSVPIRACASTDVSRDGTTKNWRVQITEDEVGSHNSSTADWREAAALVWTIKKDPPPSCQSPPRGQVQTV